jgi:hypothetical protein
MSASENEKKFTLVYDGPANSNEDTIRRIKASLLADFDLPIPEITRIMLDPPNEIISVTSDARAKKLTALLTAAGAKVHINPDPSVTLETGLSLEDDSSEAEEKPQKVWTLEIDDEEKAKLSDSTGGLRIDEPSMEDPEAISIEEQRQEEDDKVDLTLGADDQPEEPPSKETTEFSSHGISLEEEEPIVEAASPPPLPKPPPVTPKPREPAKTPAKPPPKEEKSPTQIILRPLAPEDPPSAKKPDPEADNEKSSAASSDAEAENKPPKPLNKASSSGSSSGSGSSSSIETPQQRARKKKSSNVKELLTLAVPLIVLQVCVTLAFIYYSKSGSDQGAGEIDLTPGGRGNNSSNSGSKDAEPPEDAPAPAPTASPTATPKGPVTPLTLQAEKDNIALTIVCEAQGPDISSCETSITTDEPPPLSPEQIVHNEKRAPWITRIESDPIVFNGTTAKGDVRIFIDYDSQKERVKGDISLSIKPGPLGSNQRQLEVTVLSGLAKPISEGHHFQAEKKGDIFEVSLLENVLLPLIHDPNEKTPIVLSTATPAPGKNPNSK